MASGKTWTNICPDCGRHVEIINGDFEFSMELHKQSHKSLDYINNAIDKNLNHSTEKIANTTKLLNYCNECHKSFEIINNDLSLSFQLHAKSHKTDNADALSDHSSASSRDSKGSQQTQPVVTNILDAVFHTMPEGLKAHRTFVTEQGCSKAFCNLCEVTIEPVFSTSKHLKTKQHEDNTISVIKSMFSSELHDQMEFISFYGSNLCCNLCRCKIDLCSENLHKTALNIVIHNGGKSHSSERTANKEDNKTLLIMKSLAFMNPLINENQHLIEHNMYPYFKCKPCDKQIAYSDDHNEMVSNFTDHFSSPAHVEHVNAVSLLSKWKGLNITGKENHNFVVTQRNIRCLSCNCDVETNLDQLLCHIRKYSALPNTLQSELTPKLQSTKPHYVEADHSLAQKTENINSHVKESVNKPSVDQQPQLRDVPAKFRRLILCLPTQFRNMVMFNEKEEAVCSVCKCIIPPTNYNLTTHFNGSSHKKKENEAKSSVETKNRPQQPKVLAAKAKVTTANCNIEFASPRSNHRGGAANNEYFVRWGNENKFICTLCGTIFPEDVNLERNMLLHIENEDHLYKLKLKDEMLQLLPKHREFLVEELFNHIPMVYQKEIKYIKAPEGMDFIFCEICCIKIPRHTNCLVEHLEGVYHKTSIERFQQIRSKNVLDAKQQNCDTLFQELLKSHKEIKDNSRYLDKTNEDYICKLCKAIIKKSFDKNLLMTNILGHLKGKKHQNKLEEEFNNLLDQVQISSEVVRNNRKFLKKKNDTVVCTLCSCNMSSADTVDGLKRNLDGHLLGSSHKRNLSEESTPTAAPSNAVPSPAQRRELLRQLLKSSLEYKPD